MTIVDDTPSALFDLSINRPANILPLAEVIIELKTKINLPASGESIEIENKKENIVDVFVNGKLMATGYLVSKKESLAVVITEMSENEVKSCV